MGKFRFGVNLWFVEGPSQWAAKCHRAEELGYDVLSVPDHLGRLAPFPALVTAAAVTERTRVGTLVLDTPFYNPALLARDVETTIQITGGRFELGLGAGIVKAEFDDAGLPWRPAGERIAYPESTVTELRRRLGDLPRLLIAGNSDGVLELAARQADIVGYAGLKHVSGKPPGTFALASPDELGDRVSFVRKHAGGRELEHNMLIQHVVVAENPRPELENWAADLPVPHRTEELLAAPQILAGTVDEIAERLHEHRDRFGFGYITVFEPFLETFAPVISALRGE
ncbi:MAG TPA: TIGR03621 family F420-dependent LLM class oxidoreductase [Amycolatopsis sp.]|uniref:TIGR03621 family F420-dependent LLM class oxidoreductase n=1 Tax=Amycolatopsis sp. TaxID=37632 RepID=UPI002B45C739|nr:TIGR03621 family F420-dependent LLM class oxidoreductase [Amycolatopsis sp.]HKS47874.1 TIGR03621 family F420-dependent LLM class oxidoreductase [Amycolatopsis sp.]